MKTIKIELTEKEAKFIQEQMLTLEMEFGMKGDKKREQAASTIWSKIFRAEKR